jgi:hypothetical protein
MPPSISKLYGHPCLVRSRLWILLSTEFTNKYKCWQWKLELIFPNGQLVQISNPTKKKKGKGKGKEDNNDNKGKGEEEKSSRVNLSMVTGERS